MVLYCLATSGATIFILGEKMPAAITHYLQTERVINGLKKLHPEFKYNRNAILWGAHGPDFILSHRGLPRQSGDSIKKYGTYSQTTWKMRAGMIKD